MAGTLIVLPLLHAFSLQAIGKLAGDERFEIHFLNLRIGLGQKIPDHPDAGEWRRGDVLEHFGVHTPCLFQCLAVIKSHKASDSAERLFFVRLV